MSIRRSIGSSGRGNMRNGLISLLTVVVIISLATAAVLTVATSHAMHALADRQADMAAQAYATERSGQAMLAALDDELASLRSANSSADQTKQVTDLVDKRINGLLAKTCEEGVTATYGLEGTTLTCTFVTEGGRMLQATIELGGDATYDITGWRLTAAPQEEDTGDTLWTGSTSKE